MKRKGVHVHVFGNSWSRAFAAEATQKSSFGGLKDDDRIFTNLYGQHDPFLQVKALEAFGYVIFLKGSFETWRLVSNQRHFGKRSRLDH